ncbi:uncharacterized [Tachysurus ichikawai]
MPLHPSGHSTLSVLPSNQELGRRSSGLLLPPPLRGTTNHEHILVYGGEFCLSRGPVPMLLSKSSLVSSGLPPHAELFSFPFGRFASVGGLICFLNG